MSERKIWLIELEHRGKKGIGEVAPISRLSPEDVDLVPQRLEQIQAEITSMKDPRKEILTLLEDSRFPSIDFGLEMAVKDLFAGDGNVLFDTPFSRGEESIPINGLIWMSEKDRMIGQIDEKLEAGYECIKIKVGAIDFGQELEVLEYLRSKSESVVIRLDANGAFQTNEVLFKLKELARFDIHSIEQPIAPRQPEAMKLVIQKSPIPIAFDEELIGIFGTSDRRELLENLKPHFIVLKPTLLGGFEACGDWISLADRLKIDWWITSYLESNIALNAIAQFTSNVDVSDHRVHGLGTGGLFENNFEGNMEIKRGKLWINKV